MIIECDRCYARYRYDETRFEGKRSKKVRCTKCLAIFEIFNAEAEESQPSSPGARPGEETILRLAADDTAPKRDSTAKKTVIPPHRPGAEDLKMPAGSKVSLAVIAGPEAGRMYAVEKPRVVIGRHDAEMTYYDTSSGARVFAAGVVNFAASITDPAVSRLVDNVWSRLTR